jgi:hypothetical protein
MVKASIGSRSRNLALAWRERNHFFLVDPATPDQPGLLGNSDPALGLHLEAGQRARGNQRHTDMRVQGSLERMLWAAGASPGIQTIAPAHWSRVGQNVL